jgi:hypothetical protein
MVHSQDEQFSSLVRRFEKSGRDMAREKIYLHTDKNFYLAGEIVWFKVYNVDAGTHLPSVLSKTCYIEILDRSKKPVLQAKVELSANGGSGSFYLPLSINSDNYVLRAYTNWMKNEGPAAFFEKSISIVNTIKPVEGKPQPDSIPVTCHFFPEGGNLVGGIETRLAFHIVDGYGRGVDAQGIITSDRGDTVNTFSPNKFGTGSFIFKPEMDRQYKSIIKLPDGKTFTSSLPVVYDAGYVMNITDNKDGRFRVRVQAKAKDVGQRGERVFLIAHTRQVLKVAEPGYVNYETDLVFFIDKSKLADGVSHVTLFNKDQQPVCERLVFKRPANTTSAKIASDKDAYGERQLVNLSIDASGNKSTGTDYSVAVYQVDSLQSNEGNIESYMWLSSDLRGFVESPAYYFSNASNTDEALDNLLLTQGWRRFRWEDLFNPSKNLSPLFIPEYGGHLVTVKVTDVATGQAAPDVNCFLSYPTSPYGFSVAKTNASGLAFFNARDYYGPGEIIAQPVHETAGHYRIDILSAFSDEPFYGNLPLLALTKNEESRLTGKSIAMQTQNVYVPDSIRRFYPPAFADTLPFFGKGEYTYRLDDYKRFTTMEEVLREYVTPVNVTLRNGKLYMTIYDEISKTVYNDQMLVLLDGVPLTDPNKIFAYDPLKIKKLDVVPRRYLLGGMNFKGVASFETYQGKFDGFELTPGLIAVDYEGLQLQREFYSPSYAEESDRLKRIPDMRSTLYWTPHVETGNGKLQFYTSDQSGQFIVVLQGLTQDGKPVSATHSFTVK